MFLSIHIRSSAKCFSNDFKGDLFNHLLFKMKFSLTTSCLAKCLAKTKPLRYYISKPAQFVWWTVFLDTYYQGQELLGLLSLYTVPSLFILETQCPLLETLIMSLRVTLPLFQLILLCITVTNEVMSNLDVNMHNICVCFQNPVPKPTQEPTQPQRLPRSWRRTVVWHANRRREKNYSAYRKKKRSGAFIWLASVVCFSIRNLL